MSTAHQPTPIEADSAAHDTPAPADCVHPACSAAVLECDGTTHYAGCACHERGWRNKWESAVEIAAELLNDIMNDEVNAQDEAEKWLRAYAPDVLAQNFASPPNDQTQQPHRA